MKEKCLVPGSSPRAGFLGRSGRAKMAKPAAWWLPRHAEGFCLCDLGERCRKSFWATVPRDYQDEGEEGTWQLGRSGGNIWGSTGTVYIWGTRRGVLIIECCLVCWVFSGLFPFGLFTLILHSDGSRFVLAHF